MLYRNILYHPTGYHSDHSSNSGRSNTGLTDHVIPCDALIHIMFLTRCHDTVCLFTVHVDKFLNEFSICLCQYIIYCILYCIRYTFNEDLSLVA